LLVDVLKSVHCFYPEVEVQLPLGVDEQNDELKEEWDLEGDAYLHPHEDVLEVEQEHLEVRQENKRS